MSNLTPRAKNALHSARVVASMNGSRLAEPEHLIFAILKSRQGIAFNVLARLGLDHLDVGDFTPDDSSERGARLEPDDVKASAALRKVIADAEAEAVTMGHSYVGTEHMLLAMVKGPSVWIKRTLKEAGVSVKDIQHEIKSELSPRTAEDEPEAVAAGGGQSSAANTRALRAFGRDLTRMAKDGDLDPVHGRDPEIERMVQILCRRSKNNPVLAGEAGVGKTAIVEGLALAIARGDVPDEIAGKRVVSLDMALMVAGTKYRGQFEERIKAVMDEIKKNKDVILFLDEIHTIVGAGSAEGTMDAANILKPALSRGDFQCIGATTMSEYRKYIEKDAALERRFQMVKVSPPSVDETVKILEVLRPKLEKHHGLRITDSAIDAAAKLSDRYISGRHLPDKAIDVLDEAGSHLRLRKHDRKAEKQGMREKLEELAREKNEAVKSQDFERASRIREQEIEINEQISRCKTNNKQQKRRSLVLDEDDVRAIVSQWTGIPLQKLDTEASRRLLGMEEELSEKIIGQDHAVKIISQSFRRARADLKDPRRPIGSFLFLGPTGVGKTHLAKLVAEFLFGSSESIIQIDMSEYMEKHSVSRLVGAPPGYIGHEEGGQLTEAVRRKPYSLVLFDEVEKAHPDAMNMFLQMLEEGHLTDSQGRKVSFKNSVVIMTSNAGTAGGSKESSLGFGPANRDAGQCDKILEEAKAQFRPEFLNRLDELVVFNPLDKAALSKIAVLETERLAKRLQGRGIAIELSQSAINLLLKDGYDASKGARPMRRAVERHLENPISEMLIRGEIPENISLLIEDSGGRMSFNPQEVKGGSPTSEKSGT